MNTARLVACELAFATMESKSTNTLTLSSGSGDNNGAAHLVDRGQAVKHGAKSEDIAGYDSDLMAGRSLLSKEEEKRLLRRVDLRLMPLLALILMVKNLDANNVSFRSFVHGMYANHRRRLPTLEL